LFFVFFCKFFFVFFIGRIQAYPYCLASMPLVQSEGLGK